MGEGEEKTCAYGRSLTMRLTLTEHYKTGLQVCQAVQAEVAYFHLGVLRLFLGHCFVVLSANLLSIV